QWPGEPMRAFLSALCVLLLTLSAASAADDARLAYIISLEAYDHPEGTVKRGSGADTMADALSAFGYTVQRYENPNKWDLEAILKDIYADSKGAEAAIVYVSGFALRQDQRSVVLSTNALVGGADTLMARAVETKDIVNAPRARLLNLVILDAPDDARTGLGLRNADDFTPFLDAQAPDVPNRIAVYTSAAPNDVYPRLAPMATPLTFARNFKLFLGRKERTASAFLKKVAISVFYDSAGRQFPEVTGKLLAPYLMVRKNEVSDITAWLELQAKPKAEGFEQFIQRFPDSIYIPFARQKLEELRAQ
ncbi:MAG: caspase family protein, partial [Pseudomonadota bacterium]